MVDRLLRGHDTPRIRKDAGDLTLEDFRVSPLWEFCHGEEGLPDQTECTMRPRAGTGPVNWPDFDGMMLCRFVLANGKEIAGTIHPSSRAAETTLDFSPEIWLERPAQQYTSDPLPTHYNGVVEASRHRIGFSLPKEQYCPTVKARSLMDAVYAVLGVTPAQMFPIVVYPFCPIVGWPTQLTIEGWIRADTQKILR